MEPECVVYVQLDGRPPLNRVTVHLSEQWLKEYLGYLWLIDEIKRRFKDPSPDQVANLLAVIADRSPANTQEAAHLETSEEPDESDQTAMQAFKTPEEQLRKQVYPPSAKSQPSRRAS